MSAIDFVIPSFNASRTLADTLRSILAQTRPDFTCLVIDDGSTDATHAVARSFGDPRIRVISQPNQGLSAARNRGLAESASPFVAFLDADDVIEPSYIARMIPAINSDAAFDLAACATQFLGPQLQRLDWINPVLPADLTPARLLMRNPVAVGAVMIRRSSLDRPNMLVSGHLFDPRLPCVEDWDAWLRLSMRGVRWATPISEPLFGYRITPGSMSTDHALMWRTGLRVIERHAHTFDNSSIESARRRWALLQFAKSLARAATPSPSRNARLNESEDAIESMAAVVAPFQNDDAFAFAADLRNAIRLLECTPIGQLPPARARRWHAALIPILTRYLGTNHASTIVSHLLLAQDRWPPVVDAILAIDPPARVILYGMGRNGHAICHALATHGVRARSREIYWIDDSLMAAPPGGLGLELHRLDANELKASDVVLVTLDDRAALLARLRDRCHVETPESIVSRRQHAPV